MKHAYVPVNKATWFKFEFYLVKMFAMVVKTVGLSRWYSDSAKNNRKFGYSNRKIKEAAKDGGLEINNYSGWRKSRNITNNC